MFNWIKDKFGKKEKEQKQATSDVVADMEKYFHQALIQQPRSHDDNISRALFIEYKIKHLLEYMSSSTDVESHIVNEACNKRLHDLCIAGMKIVDPYARCQHRNMLKDMDMCVREQDYVKAKHYYTEILHGML